MNNQQTLPYIAGLVLCLVLGIYLAYPKAMSAYNTYTEVQTKTQSVEETRRQIADLKSKRDTYEQEVKVSTKPVYKNEIATIDPMSSFGVMFEDVIQSAKYNGLKLKSIAYNTAPAGDVVQTNIASEYNVCAISMQLIGNYMQFRSYFQDIYNYPYLINLDKISIKPYENNKRILIADVTIVLYSVKNEAQKAAAVAAAQGAPAGDQAAEPSTTVPMPGM